MWSEHIPVKIVAWRMLQRLRNETWAADALDMLYLDDEQLAWAKAAGDHENDSAVAFHVDSNGQRLIEGDTVVTLKEGGIYPSDRAAGRRYIYDRCMTEKGWLHTHDWRMGRRGEDY